MKRILELLMCLCLLVCLPLTGLAAEKELPYPGREVYAYESDTLRYSVCRFEQEEARCYLTTVWMAEPGRQIVKSTSDWHKNLMFPTDMAKRYQGAPVMLAVNGSGYVCPQFPKIPKDYPGKGKDYYYEPLGSLTVTHGEVLRCLPGVAYYGLTLQEDGLHLHVNEDPEAVRDLNVQETWSFYDGCPLLRDGQSLLDETWDFALEKNIRTIIMKLSDNDYAVLTVTNKTSKGLTLVQCVAFLREVLQPQWAYNLDGGPSSALMLRETPTGKIKTVYGNRVKDVDILGFIE